MPDFSGIEATKMIRSGEHFKNYQDYKTIPIISLSAYSADQIANESKESGINDHLEKNGKTEQLINILNKWLNMNLKYAV